MIASVLWNITSPYTALETLVYDAIIAPGVERMEPAIFGDVLAALPRGASLLDVGCGDGRTMLNILRARPDLHATGLDLSRLQVRRARRRLEAVRDRADLVEGSVDHLPFPEGAFDAVLSIGALKHWPDRRAGMRECLRVLKQGGRLRVADADKECSPDDAHRFVSTWRVPRPFRGPCRSFFLSRVAKQSLTAKEAAALLEQPGCARSGVRKLANLPILVLWVDKQPEPGAPEHRHEPSA